MPSQNKSKLKTLYLLQMLEEQTDPEHGLSVKEIIEQLEELGVKAERKSVYRDIQTLRDFGVDIQTYQRSPIEYAIAKRDFSLSELMLLVDAVESCKFLTQRQANALITNLKLLASDNQRDHLNRRIHVNDRIKSKSESVFDNVDVLHEAIRRRRKVQFKYFKYDMKGKRVATHNGAVHTVTPVGIAFADGYYYLSAWSDDRDCMTEFRIDRIGALLITDATAVRNDETIHHSFDNGEYTSFGRFNGDPVAATLLVDADKVEIILDRFGSDVEFYEHDDSTAKAVVKVLKSEQFFGWIAGLGNTVKIDGPKSLKKEYKAYLKGLIDG